MSSKTPLSVLHELCLKKGYTPQYNLVSQDKRLNYNFIFDCSVSNLSTIGHGSSKKLARHNAAQNMLVKISELTESEHPLFDLKAKIIELAEQCDKLIFTKLGEDVTITENEPIDESKPPHLRDNPIGELLDICLNNKITPPEYELIDAFGMAHERTFTIQAKINEFTTKGEAKSKKSAKRLAAIALLKIVKENLHILAGNVDISMGENMDEKSNNKSTAGTNEIKDEKMKKPITDIIPCNVMPINELIKENVQKTTKKRGLSPSKLFPSDTKDYMYLEFVNLGPTLTRLKTLDIVRYERMDSNDFDKLDITMYEEIMNNIAEEQHIKITKHYHVNGADLNFPFKMYYELKTTPAICNLAIGRNREECYKKCVLDTVLQIKQTLLAEESWNQIYNNVLNILDISDNVSPNQSVNTGTNDSKFEVLSSDKFDKDDALSPPVLPDKTMASQIIMNETSDSLDASILSKAWCHPVIYEVALENILQDIDSETENRAVTAKAMMDNNKDWFFDDQDNGTYNDFSVNDLFSEFESSTTNNCFDDILNNISDQLKCN